MAIPVDNPHLAFPFVLAPGGASVAVVEQDSTSEILGCVQLISEMSITARTDRSDFGWAKPNLTLEPVNISALVNSINRLEPRVNATVDADATSTFSLAEAIENLSINVQVPTVDIPTQGFNQ